MSLVYDGQGDRLRSYDQYGAMPALHNEAQDIQTGLSSMVWDGQADYAYLTPGAGQAPLTRYDQSTQRTTTLGTDLLGTVRLATDPTGAVIGAGGYDAWGSYRPYQGTNGPTQLAGLQASAYSPGQGRFQSTDPQAYDPQVPVTINPYEYAGNMPTGVTDPSGMAWVSAWPASNQDNAAIRQAIISDYIGRDAANATFSNVTFTLGPTESATGAVAHADLVSLSPRLRSGQIEAEAYLLAPNLDQPQHALPQDFTTQLEEIAALAAYAYHHHGLVLQSKAKCRPVPNVRVVAGISYPESPGSLAAAGRRAPALHSYRQLLVLTPSGTYLAFPQRSAPGVIAYATCRWQSGAGMSCTPNVPVHEECAINSFLFCTLDLVTFGSLSEWVRCKGSIACRGLALVGILTAPLPVVGLGGKIIKVVAVEAAAVRDATLALDGAAGADARILVTADGQTVALTAQQTADLGSAVRRGPRLKDPLTGRGGPHNDTIMDTVSEFMAQGYTLAAGGIRTEKVVDITAINSFKKMRRLDIVMTAPDGSELYIQVGKTYANGLPVKREIEAIVVLSRQLKSPIVFRAYDKPGVEYWFMAEP